MKKAILLVGMLAAAICADAADLLSGIGQSNLKKEIGNVELITHQGKPAIRLSGRTGPKKSGSNLYLNFSLLLPKPISLEGRTLKVSALSETGAPGFYVRAYNANAKKAAWSFLSWDKILTPEPVEINLTKGRSRAMNWEPAMTDGAPADQINRIQFYLGTPEGNAELDLVITGLSDIPEIPLAEDKEKKGSPKSAPEIAEVVVLPTATPLVANGKADLEILHPDSDAGRAAAATVAAAIKAAAGADIKCRPGTAKDTIPAGSAIMIGNIFSNPALMVLYTRQQTLVDEYLPGPGGYTVETIVEPFKRGANVIVLGASDDAGLAPAAAAFAAAVKKHGTTGKLELPILFETKYTAKLSKPKFGPDYIEKGRQTALERLKVGQHTSLGGQLAGIGDSYRLYRNPLDAKLYVEVAKIYLEDARRNPSKFGGAWGFDSDFPSYEAISGWDLIEHDSALSAEDRKAVSQVLLCWLHEAIAREAIGGRGGVGPVSNHLTFASLGTMQGGLYFGKYYGDELSQPAFWLDTVKRTFARQKVSGKVHDDCDSYQWLTWRHLLVYSMGMPDDTMFKNGVAKRMLEVMGVTMDNLGTQAPYGDDSGWASSNSSMIVLEMYHAATQDPLAAYMLSMKRKSSDSSRPRNFFGRVQPAATPTDLDGLKLIPLDPDYYKYTSAAGRKPALDKCVDKFSFRAKLKPEALYMLVDGINNGGHRHADANSVLRYSHFGREWLAENEYIKNQQKYHNSLLVLYNGEAFDLPDYMEVLEKADHEQYALVKLRAAGVGPTDWIRYFLWLKNENAWCLIDELVPQKAGMYRFTQRWNGVGELTAKPDGGELEQQGSRVRLQTSADLELGYYDDADLGKQWVSYPFAKPVIRVIDQKVEKALKPNEKVQMIAVWHGAGDNAAVPEWAVDRTATGFTVHTGDKLYKITPDAGGKFQLTCEDAVPDIAPRESKVKTAAAAAATELKKLWQQQQARSGANRLTDPVLKDSVKFTLSGTTPAPKNVFIAAAPNKLEALTDGSWGDGGDSVMFNPDETVTVNFDFDRPYEISGLEIQLWWAATSSLNTSYKLDSATIEFSSDGFKKDIRQGGIHRVGEANYPNFGNTVPVKLAFEPQTAQSVRVTMKPQKGSALYIGEVSLFGQPAKGLSMGAIASELTKAIRLEDALAVGSGNGELFIYSLDGKLLDTLNMGDRINDLAAVDVDGDGKLEILVAGHDAYLRAIKRDGKEVWKVKFDQYRLYPDVTIVKTADINNDGKLEILVGCDNWQTYAYDLQGKKLWSYEVVHPTRAVEVADIDGDGKPEILAGTRYYWITALSNQGKKLWGGRFGIGCRAVAAPLNGNNRERNVVAGLANGKVVFYDNKGTTINEFNTGDEIFMMAVAPEKNGREDLFVSSFNGYVYRFTADGKSLWSVPMPGSVVVLKALPNGSVAAGTINGEVGVIDGAGKLTGIAKLDGRINDILVDDDTLRVVTANGVIASFRL